MIKQQSWAPELLAREYQYQHQRISRYLQIQREYDREFFINYKTDYNIIDDQIILEIDNEEIRFDEPDLYKSLNFISEKYIQPVIWRKLVPQASYNVLTYMAY